MRIGIDFDNTLVSYDRAFALVGMEEGLLPADFVGGKEAVKQQLCRERPDGYSWERLQGLVYGRRIERRQGSLISLRKSEFVLQKWGYDCTIVIRARC